MELTGLHETVSGKLATQIGIVITAEKLPWFIPRTCLIRPFTDVANARRPDILVLDETVLWYNITVLNHHPLIDRETNLSQAVAQRNRDNQKEI